MIDERTRKARFFRKTVLFSAIACITGFTAPAYAEDGEENYAISSRRIQKISEIIEKFVKDKQVMTDSGVQSEILKTIGREMPLEPKAKRTTSDFKKLNEQAGEIARTSLSGTDASAGNNAAILEEAAKKYPRAKLRDKVSLRVRRGSAWSTVTGILYRITKTNILVNRTTVNFIDMEDDQTRSRFDAELNQSLRDAYVKTALSTRERDFARKQQEIFDKLLKSQRIEDEKNGHIYDQDKNVWTTAKAIAQPIIRKAADDYRRKEILRLKREQERKAKEEAARKAKEEEEARQKQLENAENTAAPDGSGAAGSEEQPSAAVPEETPSAAEAVPEDIFADQPQDDGSGTFIPMSQEEISKALRNRKVLPEQYEKTIEKYEKQKQEINEKYSGIDADQGFKKALWGFEAADVHYALSKEPEFLFLFHERNRSEIRFPKGSRPLAIHLIFQLRKLCKVDTFQGDLDQEAFDIYRNMLRTKYGASETQKRVKNMDLFLAIRNGTLLPKDLPVIIEPAKKQEPEKAADKNAKDKKDGKDGKKDDRKEPEVPQRYVIVWEGQISRGILSFYYSADEKLYRNVVFEKLHMPEREKQQNQ